MYSLKEESILQRMKNRNKQTHGFGRRARPGKNERTAVKAVSPRTSENPKQMTGELKLHRDGYGFVIATRKGDEDVFIPARFVGDALHTDLVEVKVVAGREGKFEGRISRIVERRVSLLMGRLERSGGNYQVAADDRRVRHRVIVSNDKIGAAKPNDNVVVRILRYPSQSIPMLGEVVEILGERGNEDTEKSAVVVRHKLKREFAGAVMKEAGDSFGLMNEAAIKNRRDLRHLPFVTIDGETAKDFDDAVAVEKMDGGLIKLWVSIADVSYFVRPQTALDSAAYERGTSVYFPGDCLPMLPEQISNNLCSLRPNEDRYTMTAEMVVNSEGRVVRRDFYRSVINSRERMTYTSVKKILVEKDAEVRRRYQKLVPSFELMHECHKRLGGMRLRRGSIDFDLPEPEIIIDMQGEVADIVRAERHVGHMLIEDFMIAANEAVAEFLTEKEAGCVYRVHEPPPPEKLREFAVFLNNLGHKINFGKEARPASLAKVVGMVKGRPEERLVNHMLLRSMSQAVYSPENKGHFGLASKCYCHFTSPIRRYPDLVVHRLLSNVLSCLLPPASCVSSNEARGKKQEARITGLREISEHCSRRERVAMEAERETAKLYAALFMQAHTGERFEGIISHVAKFGFFVELIDFFVEGLVPIDSLTDDRYFFEVEGMAIKGRKKKMVYKVGERIKIEVSEVNVPDREIIFELC